MPEFQPERELEALLRENIEPGAACLDVGCGAGRTYALRIAPQSSRYVGVDVSQRAVELAREAGIEARTVPDAMTLPFDDESFDAAICIEVFEHLFRPDTTAREIHRVLRPGGRLVASVPNATYWRMRVNLLFGVWNPTGDALAMEQPWRDPHLRFFTASALERMLTAGGFSNVEVGAHGGCFLDHATSRPTNFGQSRVYRRAEELFPSLLGMTLHATARR